MQAKKLLHTLLEKACATMHGHRFSSLLTCCNALLLGQRLTLTQIGRAINNQVAAKHNIKKVDRLLSNPRLHQECFSIYASLAQTFLLNVKAPVILVDWSDLTPTRSHFLLRATLAVKGRPITLYEEVHEQLDSRKTHEQFLQKLKQLLPENAKPIIVTDAGFRGTWIKAVLALEWDFVARVRGATLIANSADSPWFSCKKLMATATAKVQDFHAMRAIAAQNINCRLCLIKKSPKDRHQKNINGTHSKRKKSQENARSAKEPWLIATSLSSCPAKTVIDYYATRMQIEEGFRDIKNTRYGLALRFTGTRTTQRLKVLMLIAHIVTIIFYLIGLAAETKKMHLKMQSSSLKSRRVLSHVYLGSLLIQCGQYKLIQLHEIKRAIQSIIRVIEYHDFA